MPRARSVGRSLRLRGPGGPAGVVLRRSRSPGAGGGHAKATDGGPAGGRGAQPRWSQRDGGRRLGAHGPGDPPRGAPRPGAQRGRTVDAWRATVRDHAARWARFLRDAAPASDHRPPGGGGLGSPGHAVGRLRRAGAAARPRRPWGTTVTTRSSRRGRRGPSPAVPGSRSASRPGDRDGSLLFVSDRRGWWQPYVHSGLPGAWPDPTPLTDLEAEFHGPDWVLGQRTMAEMPDGTVMARMTSAGRDALVPLDRAGPGERRTRRRRWRNPVSPLPRSARTVKGWP